MNNDKPLGEKLSAGGSAYGITLDDRTIGRFVRYDRLVREWNPRMNLISRGDLGRFAEYHLLDSLKVASCFDFRGVRRLIDFGSGAGLPGIPIALAFPHIAISLVDSRKKRCIFLEAAVRELGLGQAAVFCGRLEHLDFSFDGSCDAVTSRGTVSLERFFTSSARFLAPGGSLIAIKGDRIDDELESLSSAVDRSVFNISHTHPVPVPGVRTGQVILVTKC
ncbi:16S rRNA (guanine(527)-N(7))-methyltransferase RsmG [Candidatus Latescibacterota bacterium]